MSTSAARTTGKRYIRTALCTLTAGAIVTASSVYALAPGSTEGWNAGSDAGWTLLNYQTDVTSALAVSDNSAQVPFPMVGGIGSPSDLIKGVAAEVSASGGAFVGDYYNGGVGKVRFRVFGAIAAANIQVILLSDVALAVELGCTITDVPAGEWTDVEIPLTPEAGWGVGSFRATEKPEQFYGALQSVTRLVVAVSRDGSEHGAHSFLIDDVAIDGIPLTVTLSGIANYNGPQSGTTRVLATGTKYSWSLEHSASANAGGAYAIGQIPSQADYWLKAFVDSNANGTHDFWEAYGWYNNETQLSRLLGDLAGLNIQLDDPTAADGLPYWWLKEQFGISDPAGSGGAATPGADEDSDGDTMSNFAEYRAGTLANDFASRFVAEAVPTDGGMLVRWVPNAGTTYSVWRSGSPASGFVKLNAESVSGGEYVDTSAGDGPSYYRVEVE